PYARPYWLLAAVSALTTILASAAGLLAPWPVKILIDNVLGQDPLPEVLARPLGALADDRVALLIVTVVAGLGVTLVDSGVHVLSNYVNTRLEQSIVLDFRNELFRHA